VVLETVGGGLTGIAGKRQCKGSLHTSFEKYKKL